MKPSTGPSADDRVSVFLPGPHTHAASPPFKWIWLNTGAASYLGEQSKGVQHSFTMCYFCYYYYDYFKQHCPLCPSSLARVSTSHSLLNLWFPPARWLVSYVCWMQCSFAVKRHGNFSERDWERRTERETDRPREPKHFFPQENEFLKSSLKTSELAFNKAFVGTKMGCLAKYSEIALDLCSIKGKSPQWDVLFCFKSFLAQHKSVFLLLVGTSRKMTAR